MTPPLAVPTVRALILAFLRYQAGLIAAGDDNALGARTLANYRYSLEGPIMDAFGTLHPRQVKPSHLAQYLMAARTAKRAVTANRDVAALASAFNYAMALGVVDANPCRGVRRNKERPRTRAVAIAEVNDLLALAEERGGSSLMVALIAVTVALTGRRRGEVLALPREAATPEGLVAEDLKTRRHGERVYLIAWSPLLRQVVERAASMGRGAAVLFPTQAGAAYTDSGFKCLWNRLMTAYEAKHGSRFRAHDLRALYVSEMLDRGESPNTHANEATMRRVYDRRRVIPVKPLA